MHVPYKWSLLAASLFILLVLSFLWCMVDNIWRSSQMEQAGEVVVVSAGTLLAGYLWLVGHGIHGAAVIALPALLLRRDNFQYQIFS